MALRERRLVEFGRAVVWWQLKVVRGALWSSWIHPIQWITWSIFSPKVFGRLSALGSASLARGTSQDLYHTRATLGVSQNGNAKPDYG